MRTAAIGLLIWLVIMLSEQIHCMDDPCPAGQKDTKPAAIASMSTADQKPPLFPHLYSEDAIKKAWKQGYRSGMQDSNQTIVSLDAQRQHVHSHNVQMQEKITHARDQLDTVLTSLSPKSPQFAQLQALWALLNQASEPPKQ